MEYILCDDDIRFVKTLSEHIQRFGRAKGWKFTIKAFHRPQLLLQYADQPSGEPRIYFLDIEMPGYTGFQLAEHLRKTGKNVRIVFVSGRDELVFQSMEYAPFYFLRKNRLEAELGRQLVRLRRDLSAEFHKIAVASGGSTVTVCPELVVYAESDKNYVYLYREGKKAPVRIRTKLSVLEEEWTSYGFLRVHRSYLVNLSYIAKLEGKQLFLTTGESIDVGRSWLNQVKSHINNLEETSF